MLVHSGLQIINQKLLKNTVKNSVAKVSNPQKIICIIFENLISKIKSDATNFSHITKNKIGRINNSPYICNPEFRTATEFPESA